ncbi:putative phosphorylase [Aspergillus saccharolyticus JOP 1030-1]|uniref:Putative phosphorylase n=1 Tax=Aspergillus saccharolyticus JOP 1030-1 TaxID=1450539 RepID=A0A319A220_9EURO|nr:putative phosphorylase [Aspergillus saccharolyticus JOP 1030-1]PYH46318.1 putative phosphorylase [Aspergillus saccharolyticus JOP 1030-1]
MPSFSAKHTLSTLTHATALSEFDSLVRRGLVVHSPCKIVRLTVDNFHFEFQISKSLTNKPQSGQGLQPSDKDSPDRPATFGPGSDLACPTPDLILATIHETHILVPNGYSVFRPQYLLLTQDSYRRQHEPLSLQDLEAVRAVLCALATDGTRRRRYFAMFNCGHVAGASRQHKHMHIIPWKASRAGILPTNRNPRSCDIPFVHFRAALSPSEFRAEGYAKVVVDKYVALLGQMQAALGDWTQGSGGECMPHNVILVEEWILVIPRSKDRYSQDVTVNGAGMAGSVWLDREEVLERWLEIGPLEVLRGVGYAV